MDLYKLMVIKWSIFTLSIQLIYCASVYSNVDSPMATESICRSSSSLQLSSTSGLHFEQYNSEERHIESSLIYDLNSEHATVPCKIVLVAPESSGFLVRLIRPKLKKSRNSYNMSKRIFGEAAVDNGSSSGSSTKIRNATISTCPLSIISSNDPFNPPWKLDPCQLEAHGLIDEPVRFLPGRLKIIWNHGGSAMSAYKLIVTVIGKGYHCKSQGKHPCLTIGQETMLCISDTLLCDGIHHCPSGSEYNSDEDPEFCSKQRNSVSDGMEDHRSVWEKLSNEFNKYIFPPSATTTTTTTTTAAATFSSASSSTPSPTVYELDTKRDRATLTRGLSRYGPWGYLMLGMLLCGGALLVCGLWECCCRSKKPVNPADLLSDPNLSVINTISGATEAIPPPPNYDEIDPPPSYSTLFPNQKIDETASDVLPQQLLPPPNPSQSIQNIINSSNNSSSANIATNSPITVAA